MDDLIEKFRVELSDISNFNDKSVALYISGVYRLASYMDKQFQLPLVEVKADHLITWIVHLRDDLKLEPETIKLKKSAIKKFFTYLITLGLIKKNPAANIPSAKVVHKSEGKVIPRMVVVKLLASFDLSTWMGLRNRLIVSLLWTLGLRVSELGAIKIKDLRLDYDPKHFVGMLLVHGKARQERSLFIVGRLYKILVHYLAHSRSPKKKNMPLICYTNHKPMGVYRIRQMIKETAKKAGITQRIHPHLFRHTFATEMYHQAVPIEAIKDMLGHCSLGDTSIYIHVPEKIQEEVLAKLTTGGKG